MILFSWDFRPNEFKNGVHGWLNIDDFYISMDKNIFVKNSQRTCQKPENKSPVLIYKSNNKVKNYHPK